MAKYIISIDQSTQGTKALLFDETGSIMRRTDRPHRQIINEKGWVSHDPEEIYSNVLEVVKELLEGVEKEYVVGLGISNQRETSLAWNRVTGKPYGNAVVWQCARAVDICARVEKAGAAELIRQKTGMNLSPYFPASKIAWLLENEEGAKEAAERHEICHGTIDSWLVYKLTGDHAFKTDFSNASRTQLFNLKTLAWDEKICEMFGIPVCALARVCDSDAVYGTTTMEGLFSEPVPICGVLGDSHAALFGQGCLKPGMIKATYGTGSSLMMNIGDKPIQSSHGVVTSLAWGRGGKVDYVLEGNLNYTGAVITWLKDDLKLISSAKETEGLAREANPADRTYLVPAFTGLALDCIAYQITDLVRAMEQDTGMRIEELRVDGGPTRNGYLMQFQSDITNKRVNIPDAEELSGIGAAYMAGISAGVYDLEKLAGNMKRSVYEPKMDDEIREKKYAGWKKAVDGVLSK